MPPVGWKGSLQTFFFCPVTVGFGDSVPCGPGHPSDESSRAHPVGYGGHVTGIMRLVHFVFVIVYIGSC